MFLFLLVVAVWVCFFVDEADPTLPPLPIGPGLAKTRSGAMSAPVEVGKEW